MGVGFKTLRELKQKLPEVLADIKRYNLLADAERVMLDLQLKGACRCLVGERDWSWWESDKSIQETYRNLKL